MMKLAHRVRLLKAVSASTLAIAALSALGQEKKQELLQRDFPFQGACIGAAFPSNNVALKGLAIRLVTNDAACVLFDTEMLRMAAGWSGGFITTHGVAFDGAHGSYPQIAGKQAWGTRKSPGWANAEGKFEDPRPEPFGPLPKEWCHWEGLSIHGQDVLLNYTVHGTAISEQPSAEIVGDSVAFIRTFQTGRAKSPLLASLADFEGATITVENGSLRVIKQERITWITLAGAPRGVSLEASKDGRAQLRIAKGTRAALFSVILWEGATKDIASTSQTLSKHVPALAAFKKGGPAHWPESVITKGALETSTTPDKAYVTDSITAPTDNPWHRRIRFAGLDFFSDGKRAALCTHDGDIWIVSGINASLDRLEWRRFASGQYETLGLVIVNDVIYTSGRDQITRYRDINGDGEADVYENFNNDYMSTEGFHEFLFDLQRDGKGNFYFAKANPVNSGGGGFGNQKASKGNGTVCSHSGCLFKLSPDGKNLEIYARGFRAPNGIGVSADGQLTSSDNEGTWVPTTPIHWIEKGQFCGVINNLTPKATADSYVPPLCWLAKSYDNSGGGQIWVDSDKWGPFKGRLLHESYGKSSLFLVMQERMSSGRMQGGVVRFPLKFTSSVMRAKFHKGDGQLYICGLSEWQSNAGKITGFDRVRYTGKPVYSVKNLRVDHNGVHLSFTQPLDRATATDLQNYSGSRWNYERAEHYGSPEFSVEDPKKRGHDTIDITGASLSPDGMEVTLKIADLKPVMQQTVKFNLKAADGTPISQEVMHTIHEVP